MSLTSYLEACKLIAKLVHKVNDSVVKFWTTEAFVKDYSDGTTPEEAVASRVYESKKSLIDGVPNEHFLSVERAS